MPAYRVILKRKRRRVVSRRRPSPLWARPGVVYAPDAGQAEALAQGRHPGRALCVERLISYGVDELANGRRKWPAE